MSTFGNGSSGRHKTDIDDKYDYFISIIASIATLIFSFYELFSGHFLSITERLFGLFSDSQKFIKNSIFMFFSLPILFFPLSTAAAGISGVIFLILFSISGYWRNYRIITTRSWFIPLTLLISWTVLGVSWSTADVHDIWIAISRLGYFLFAYCGAMLPWDRTRFLFIPSLFLFGLALNWIVGLCQLLKIWPWHPLVPSLGPVGYANHIYLSMSLTMAVIWIAYDIRDKALLPRWLNFVIALAFTIQLAMGAGRTGQVLFILLVPVAVWILFSGRWRYVAITLLTLAITGMGLSPMVQTRVHEGLENLKIINNGEYDTSLGLRILMAEGALYMGLHNPLLGVGTGAYSSEMVKLQKNHNIPSLSKNVVMSQPQNSYLIELAMLGLPGLSLFLCYLWSVTINAWRFRQTPEGWFILTYMMIFLMGSLSDTLIWGYANVFTLAILTSVPIPLVLVASYNK